LVVGNVRTVVFLHDFFDPRMDFAFYGVEGHFRFDLDTSFLLLDLPKLTLQLLFVNKHVGTFTVVIGGTS